MQCFAVRMQEGGVTCSASGSRDGIADPIDQLSDLQDKLDVSYQWAYDLEIDLKDAWEHARRSEDRCKALETVVNGKNAELQRALSANCVCGYLRTHVSLYYRVLLLYGGGSSHCDSVTPAEWTALTCSVHHS